MTIDFRSDPIGQRIKGWKAPPNSPRTRLVPGWEPRPEFGAGQTFDEGGFDQPIPPIITPLVPADRADRVEPYDWAAIRAAVFPEGLGPPAEPTPEPPPPRAVPADREERMAKPATNVYDPSQARTLSSSAPTPARPPAVPPTASRSAPAAGGPGGAGPSLPRSQQDFVSAMLPRAQAIARQTGIDPTVMIAIAANETGWGTSKTAREQNNLFSIQGPAGRASRWATYESPEASFQAFASLISTAPRYKQAWAVRDNPDAFVDELRKAGYVADEPGFPAQGWVNQVKSINRRLAPADVQAATSTSTGAGGYVFPVQGYSGKVVPDHWGEVKGGSDLFAKPGTPVLAMRGGKVVSAGFNKVGGNAVTIQGDDGLEYYYAHLIDTPTVRSGQEITAGTHLGGVGDTGNARGKGAHLHIGIGPSIRAGSDKYGGTGGDFNAVALMNAALTGKGAPPTGITTGGGASPTSVTTGTTTGVGPSQGRGPVQFDPDRVRAPMSVARPEDLRRVVKYVDNEDGTYTAHYEDGTTAIEKTPRQLAPIEGGRHPRTVGAKPTSSKRPGAGQEGEGFFPVSGGLFPSGEGRSQAGSQPAPMVPADREERIAAAAPPAPPAPQPAPRPTVTRGREDSSWTSAGTHGGYPAADIFGDEGQPIRAPVGGESRPAVYPKGGNATIIQGDDGKYYYMAHGHVPFTGGRVEAGQEIGQVGRSGNAGKTDAHVHFAIGSNPNVFGQRGGSGDIAGGPEYWQVGDEMGAGGEGGMGAGDDWWRETDQPALAEPDLPWWEQASRVAQAGIGGAQAAVGGAAQGIQEALGGAAQGVQEAVGGAAQAAQQGVQDVGQAIVEQVTRPAVLQPGQRPAREVVPEIPGQIGEVFSGLGTAAREIVEEPEVKAARLAAGEEEERKRKAQQELERRRKITPEGVLPAQPLQIGPPPEEGEGYQPPQPAPANPPVLGPMGMPLLEQPKPGSPFDRAVKGEIIGQMEPGDQLAAVLEWNALKKKTLANAVPLEDPMLRDIVAMGLDPETYLTGGPAIGAARVIAAKTGSHLLANTAASAIMEGPRLVAALQSGDPEQIAIEAAIITAGGVVPSAGRQIIKAGGQVANAVSDIGPQMARRLEQVTGPLSREGAALADALRPVSLTYSNSPLGQFLAAESGQATSRMALTLAAEAGGGGVIGGLAATAPNLIHPDLDDPGWQARTWDDFWTGARYGGALGLGGGALGIVGKYGWDKTFGPRVTRAFWAAVEPVRNIPSPYAQEAMIQRAMNNGGTRATAEVLEEQAWTLFGRGGQQLNTRDVAMYIEENGTLANYRGPNGERPTQKQIEWVEGRVADEIRLGNEGRAIGVLGKTQDVTTPLGDPGPTAHVMHTYDFEKNRRAVARGPRGLGWRGTVQRPRNKTTNPNIDSETPITIREAMADHVAHPSERPAPTDSMTDRFVNSFRQQEEALANRRAWITISADKRVVWRPARGKRGAGLKAPDPPDDFVPVKEEWGLGRGSEGAYVHKDLASVYTNLTSVSPVGLRGAVSALRPVRELVFAGAVSHMFNVGWRTMLSTGPIKNAQIGTRAWKAFWNPNAREQFILENPATWIAAHEAGITPGAVTADIYGRTSSLEGVIGQGVASGVASGLGGYAQAKLRGESDEEARWAAAVWAGVGLGLGAPGPGALIARNERKGLGEEWHRSIIALSQEAVFDRALPLAKVTGWAALTKAGVAPGAAAEVMNNTIGGLNTAKMARAPWLQDLMRVGLMAPDWFESQIRQVGSLFVPGEVGAYSREVILKNAITYGAFIESLNMAFNGHPTWENEPGYELTLETTGMLEKLGQIRGEDMVQRHPESGVVQRTYADFLPNLRWVLNIAGEATRTGLEGYGTLMSATGNQGPGERLRGMARGNMAEGEVPPNLAGELGNVISNRANQAFRVAGNLSAMAKGEQSNWTGRRYETPHFDENSTVWDKVLAVARAAEGLAPAEIQQAQRTVNVLHPERSDWGDTIIESLLGLTRIGRTTEQGVQLRKKDEVLGFLNIQPRDAQLYEESYRNAVDQNSEKRSTLLNSLGPGGSSEKATHAKAAEELSDLAAARTHNSRRDQIERDYVAKTPDFLKDQVRTFLNNVYRVGDQGSANQADVPQDIDLDAIWQRYWNPPDADPLNKDEMRRGQRRVLVESALELGVDSEALLDQIKWRAQNGALDAQAPVMPALPGVTSGKFDVAIEQFLGAGVDPKTGIRIDDDDIRADLQRQALKDQAAQLGVDPRTLLRRINLRLSPASQLTTVEASYQTALQALYESYDADQFPRYRDENGNAQGTREDWERNDLIIGKEGMARAKRLPDLQNLALAKERGQNAREKWLAENPGSTQFDRWFGTGRNMTEPQWREYAAGRTVGYDDLDLDADLLPPRNETIRRDKIQQLYRASNLDERLDTDVEVWANGGYITMNLLAASRYLRHYMKNTAGRTLEYLAAHDELDPKARPALRAGSTVGAEQ